MTINERVSDERLAEYAAQESDLANKPFVYEDSRRMARELQQYRAAAEPVGEVVLGDYDDCGDYPDAKVVCIAAQGQADWNNFRNGTKLYAAPQVTSVPEELLSAMEDVLRISDRDHDAWNRAKYAIAAIRSAPAVQAEQLSGNTEQVSQPVLPEPITRNDADGWWMYKGRRVGGGCAEWYNWALDDCRAAIASGNSPAIPDGYALVPVEPTIAMLDELDSIIDYGADDSNDAWSRLLAAAWIKSLPAAPHQEAE